MAKTAVCILVGGASSRMGQDKASLPLPDGRNLLQLMLAKFSETEHLIFLSGTPQAARDYGVPIVADLFAERKGPVGGIVSSVLWLSECQPQVEVCYFVPVDLPNLDRETLWLLEHSSGQGRSFVDHPLPLRLELNSPPRDLCSDLAHELVALDGYSVRQFRALLDSFSEVRLDTPTALRNFNHFYQWEQYIHENSI